MPTNPDLAALSEAHERTALLVEALNDIALFATNLALEMTAGRLVQIDREGMRENIADVYTKGWRHAKVGNGSFRDATVDAAIAAMLGEG